MGMFFLLYLSLLGAATAKYEYNGETPLLDLTFTKTGTDIPKSSAILTLDETESFVLGTACAGANTCTKTAHTNVYDDEKYKGENIESPFTMKYQKIDLSGNSFRGLFVGGNIDSTETFRVVDDISGDDKVELEQDAVLGLGFAKQLVGKNFAAAKFLTNAANGKKVLIFRRGPFKQQLQTEELKSPKGTFEIGETTLDGCGTFVYTDTIKEDGWKIKAKVVIGTKELTDQTISFSLDQLTTVPESSFNEFKDKKAEDLPEISIEFGSTKFSLKKQNLQNYGDAKHEKMELLLKSEPRTSFLLGRNFLSDYCIALKASNDLNTLQVGLAPITEQAGDPKLEKYSKGDDGKGGGDKGGDGDGDNDKGKGKDKGAFTASCSVILQLLSASMLAFIARLAQ